MDIDTDIDITSLLIRSPFNRGRAKAQVMDVLWWMDKALDEYAVTPSEAPLVSSFSTQPGFACLYFGQPSE